MRKVKTKVTVEFADLDGMRAVYHANYLKWMDLARTQLYMEAGFKVGEWEQGGVLLPLVVCNCEYKASAVFKDVLEVTAEVISVERKVCTISYEMRRESDDLIVCTAVTKQVFCDENSRSFVLKDRYPELYDALVLEDGA